MNELITSIGTFGSTNPCSTVLTAFVILAAFIGIFQSVNHKLISNTVFLSIMGGVFVGFFVLFIKPLTGWVDANALIYWLACWGYVYGLDWVMLYGHETKGMKRLQDFLPW